MVAFGPGSALFKAYQSRISSGKKNLSAGRKSSTPAKSSRYSRTPLPGAMAAMSLPKVQTPTSDPRDQLLDLMNELLGGGGTQQVDMGDLRSQIEAQINPVFDARRRAIENLMQRATQRTASNRSDVLGGYNALGTDYEKQAGVANQEAIQAAQEAAALQGKLKANIHGNYSRVQDEQAALFKELGIEAAAPAIVPGQSEDEAFTQGLADVTGTANQQYLKNQGTTDQQYYRQGAPLARLAGQNKASDLQMMLESYLQDQGNAIGELEAQRGSDILSSFNQMAGQAQSAASQSNNQLWSRLMDLYGIQSDRMKENSPQATGDPIIDVATRMGLPPQYATQAQDAAADIKMTPAFLYGTVRDPRTDKQVKATPARYEEEIRKYAREHQLPPQILNALLQALVYNRG